MPITSYEFGDAWPQDTWPPYYSVSWPQINFTENDTYIAANTTGGPIVSGGSGSGTFADSGTREIGNSGSYPYLEAIVADAFMSTTTTSASSGASWNLYTTSFETGSTTASTTAVSSTTFSVENETVVTSSLCSHSLNSTQTAASDEVIYGTFLTANSGYTGPISDLSTTSSISLSYGSTAILATRFIYLSMTDLNYEEHGADYGQTWIYNAPYSYESTSETTITLSGMVPLQGYKNLGAILSWEGTTWGNGGDVYLADSQYGTDLQPSGLLTASEHPGIREAISYSTYTSGYYITGDSVIYQTTTLVSGSTVGTTASSSLSVDGSAISSVTTSGIIGFSNVDFTTFTNAATFSGGQNWSVSYNGGASTGMFLAITNASDGTSSKTFTVDNNYSSVISCATDANVVIEPLILAIPPVTYSTDSVGSTYSGYPDGTYWIN